MEFSLSLVLSIVVLSPCDAVPPERAESGLAETAAPARQNRMTLMMLVPSDPLDIVPRRRLMTAVALGDLHWTATLTCRVVVLPCDPLRNHVEVLHIMAGWSLMTLDAVE